MPQLDGELDARMSASMRPSGITDGIPFDRPAVLPQDDRASMRPSGITDGIATRQPSLRASSPRRFNEAVGYYRRNLTAQEIADNTVTEPLQ